MKLAMELSSKFQISMLFLVFLSVLISKGACQTVAPCQSYQCKTCANDSYGCIDCRPGKGLSMELYPSPNYVCRDCGAFCANCVNRTNCTECNPGYGPSPLDSTICEECIIPNCLACPVATPTCAQCKSEYAFYSGSNACGACSAHCLFGCDQRFPGNCDRCDPGYGYVGTTFVCGACSLHCGAGCIVAGAGKCDKCDPGFGFTSTNSCEACSLHCMGGCSLTGAGKCDKCDSGYVPATNGACELITTTPIAATTTIPKAATTTIPIAATTTIPKAAATTIPIAAMTIIPIAATTNIPIAATTNTIPAAPDNGKTGSPGSQITGQTDATLNPITGVTGISGYPNNGSTKAPGSGSDRFNSNAAIMATLLSLILGGIVISVFVISCWASRFSQAAAAAVVRTQAAAIKTPILHEHIILQEPVRRMVIVPDDHRYLRN